MGTKTTYQTSAGGFAEAPLRSSGGTAPTLSIDLATDSSPGVVQPDGSTITIDGNGVISAAGGGGGGPVIVGTLEESAQTTPYSEVIATPVTDGVFLLTDYFTPTDLGSDFPAYVVSWTDDAGAQSSNGAAFQLNHPVSAGGANMLNNGSFSDFSGVSMLFPTTIRAKAGTPITVSVTTSGTPVTFNLSAVLLRVSA